jgi:hypothetical protein
MTVAGLSRSTPDSAVAKRVRVALAADLAIGDDVDAGGLHVADRELGRVVLRGFDWTEISRWLYCPKEDG